MAKKQIPWADLEEHMEAGWKDPKTKRLLGRQVKETLEELVSLGGIISTHQMRPLPGRPYVISRWRLVIKATPQNHVGDIWCIAGERVGRPIECVWGSSVDLVIRIEMGWNRDGLAKTLHEATHRWIKGFDGEVRVKKQLDKLMLDLDGVFCIYQGAKLDMYGIDFLVEFEGPKKKIPPLYIDVKSSRGYVDQAKQNLAQRGIETDDWYFPVVTDRISNKAIYRKLKKRVSKHISLYGK